MKLNGYPLDSFSAEGERADFWARCTLEQALALDGSALVVTHDDGEEYRRFEGYEVAQVGHDGPAVLVRAIRALEPAAEQAISALEANVQTLYDMQSGTGAAMAASRMYVNSTAVTNTQLSDVRDLIEDFAPGAEYKKGWIRRYEGKYYRMAKDIDSATSTTYQPGTGTESLYTLIDLAPDGIRVWHMPTDATNSFAMGEKAHYPDADGAVYVSQREGNTSEPTKDEWWAFDSEGE